MCITLMIYKKNEKKSVQLTLEVVDLDFLRVHPSKCQIQHFKGYDAYVKKKNFYCNTIPKDRHYIYKVIHLVYLKQFFR